MARLKRSDFPGRNPARSIQPADFSQTDFHDPRDEARQSLRPALPHPRFFEAGKFALAFPVSLCLPADFVPKNGLSKPTNGKESNLTRPKRSPRFHQFTRCSRSSGEAEFLEQMDVRIERAELGPTQSRIELSGAARPMMPQTGDHQATE